MVITKSGHTSGVPHYDKQKLVKKKKKREKNYSVDEKFSQNNIRVYTTKRNLLTN